MNQKTLKIVFGIVMLGIIGFLNKFISDVTLNILVIAGLCVLLLSVIPYTNIARKSEKDIDAILKSLIDR